MALVDPVGAAEVRYAEHSVQSQGSGEQLEPPMQLRVEMSSLRVLQKHSVTGSQPETCTCTVCHPTVLQLTQ